MSRALSAKLLLLVLICSGCEPGKPAVAPSDDTQALAKLGGEAVGEVVLSKPVSGADEKAFETDFDKIMAADSTVNDKIKACRATPKWLPAELVLITPLEVGNIEQEFGQPGKKVKKHNASVQKELDFYNYGNLELGVDGSKVAVILLNK